MKTIRNNKQSKTFKLNNEVIRRRRNDNQWEHLGPYGWQAVHQNYIRALIKFETKQ